jgi:hypothetical protein
LALYPITDTCADYLSLSSPSDIVDYLNDPDDAVVTDDINLNIAVPRKPDNHELKISIRSLSKQASMKYELGRRIEKTPILANDVKAPQNCRPLFSALPPPLV